MKTKMHFVALRTVKYSDRHSILQAYSREAGRVAFLVPAGTGREASRRRALLMPLSIAECVAEVRPGRDIFPMGQLMTPTPLLSIRSNPVKGALTMFLAEMLQYVVREAAPDMHIYEFLEYSIGVLERLPASRCANYHLCFLWHLGRLIGIEPDMATFSPGRILDMSDGVWRDSAPLHTDYLPADESRGAAMLSRMNYDNMHLFRMTRAERNTALDRIVHFFSLHVGSPREIRSLEVSRTLF